MTVAHGTRHVFALGPHPLLARAQAARLIEAGAAPGDAVSPYLLAEAGTPKSGPRRATERARSPQT